MDKKDKEKMVVVRKHVASRPFSNPRLLLGYLDDAISNYPSIAEMPVANKPRYLSFQPSLSLTPDEAVPSQNNPSDMVVIHKPKAKVVSRAIVSQLINLYTGGIRPAYHLSRDWSILLHGATVGAGLQVATAYIALASCYIIGIPVAVVLGYIFRGGLQVVWSGTLCGLLVQLVSLLIILGRKNGRKR